jgi:hypothetical protein
MMKKQRLPITKGWSLYWVYSDGLEDCFVVARNVRSAIKVDREMNGFEPGQIGATKVCSIPESVARWQQRRLEREGGSAWPWYARDSLLKKLGAQFRERDGLEEVLIEDVVYAAGQPARTIGKRFLDEFRGDPSIAAYGEEDRYSGRQIILCNLLGICVARCHQIESYISDSFILAVSAKEKDRYKTIDELRNAWRKKTLGQLVRTIEESYDLEPLFKQALDWFVQHRNRLIHGLTTDLQFDIESAWGQDEIIAFLVLFEMMSRLVRKAFRACFLCSMDLGIHVFGAPEGMAKSIKWTRKQRDEMSLFPEFFRLKSSE